MSLRPAAVPRRLYVLGTPIVYFEVYAGEKYLLPLSFKQGNMAIDITSWMLGITTKYYTADYDSTEDLTITPGSEEQVTVDNLKLITPQPSTPADLTVSITNGMAGLAQLNIPASLTPATYVFPTSNNPILLCVVTMVITRQDSSVTKEKLGFVIRDF